jgi:SAM-dependent methyltransferase
MGGIVMKNKKYISIIQHYEECLEKYGDTHQGVDWPKKEDVDIRYQVMLDLVKDKGGECTLLDFGCGTAHLYEYIKENKRGFKYSGLDLSEKFITVCRKKYPDLEFYAVDILEDSGRMPEFDYIVMNGVFTEKRELSYEEMLLYFKEMISAVFKKTRKGLAFNVMSKHVDWERDDLFHLPFDELASFLTKDISRNFVIKNDYGLFEYTVYIYKE